MLRSHQTHLHQPPYRIVNLLKDSMILFFAHVKGLKCSRRPLWTPSTLRSHWLFEAILLAPSLPFPLPFDRQTFTTQCDSHEHHHNLSNSYLLLKKAFGPRVLLMFKRPVSLSYRETFDTQGALQSLMIRNSVGLSCYAICHNSINLPIDGHMMG